MDHRYLNRKPGTGRSGAVGWAPECARANTIDPSCGGSNPTRAPRVIRRGRRYQPAIARPVIARTTWRGCGTRPSFDHTECTARCGGQQAPHGPREGQHHSGQRSKPQHRQQRDHHDARPPVQVPADKAQVAIDQACISRRAVKNGPAVLHQHMRQKSGGDDTSGIEFDFPRLVGISAQQLLGINPATPRYPSGSTTAGRTKSAISIAARL